MKRGAYIFITCCLSILIGGCESLLDKKFDDNIDDQMLLSNREMMIGLLNEAYVYLPRNDGSYNCVDGAMLDCATDDAVESTPTSAIHNMTNGAWGPYNVVDDKWAYFYAGIRKVQTFLHYIALTDVVENNEIPGSDMSRLKDRLIGEAYFLQALYYFELTRRYGDVPLVESLLEPDIAALDIPRTPYDEIVQRIVTWCENAASILPVQYSDVNVGRATKGAALMLKARTLLYAASELHNPNHDQQKWIDAEKATREFLEFNKTNGEPYKLYASFADQFLVPYNSEVIFATQYLNRKDVEQMNVPNGYTGGLGHTNPSQNLVDAFEIKIDGVYVPYDKKRDEAKMYSSDRDPRLAATVLYNGANFKDRPVETFVGGRDGLNLTPNHTKTGYYLRKFLDPSINMSEDQSLRRVAWVIFRYAEALLNYAEARNEMLPAPDEQVYEALSAVRERSMGAAGRLTADLNWSKEEMRARIRNERRVEFAFEEHRFWDVRRWNEAETQFTLPIEGIRITMSGDSGAVMERFVVDANRKFTSPMYYYPIHYQSALKAPTTGQTVSWR